MPADRKNRVRGATWSVRPFTPAGNPAPEPRKPPRTQPKPDAWELFTPDYDYEKEPYFVRSGEGQPSILCYPNAGIMNAMDGTGRNFYPCKCEVQLAGWEADPYYPSNEKTP